MDSAIFNQIKKEHDLKCTQKEFESYLAKVEDMKFDISYNFYPFTEKYNGVEIKNPTGDPNALYYVLKINGVTYLQNHAPYESGFVPITEENKDEIIQNHINRKKEEMNNAYKIQKAIEYFSK